MEAHLCLLTTRDRAVSVERTTIVCRPILFDLEVELFQKVRRLIGEEERQKGQYIEFKLLRI